MKKVMMSLLLSLLTLTSAYAGGDREVFKSALSKYEKVYEAFFADNLEAAKKEAGLLNEELKKLTDEKVKKTLAFTQKKLEGLKTETQLREAHKAFNVISQGLLVVLEKHIPNKSYARYYCPMVKKYWIQNISESEKVMNPYAAKSMPHCGARMAKD